MRRTVPVILAVGSDDAVLLRETVGELLWAATNVGDQARRGATVNG